jgi:hypothetical protein
LDGFFRLSVIAAQANRRRTNKKMVAAMPKKSHARPSRERFNPTVKASG